MVGESFRINKRQLRRDLFAENPNCPTCGRGMVLKFKGKKPPNTLATLDHIIPLIAGGSDQKENLQLICGRCNHEKDGYLPEEHEAKKRIKRAAIALKAAKECQAGGVEINPDHVTLSCVMCEAIGLDPNAQPLDGDPTRNWQMLLPAAAAATMMLRPPRAPDDDMMSFPAPDGNGFIFRIDGEGQLHIRDDLAPGTPLFTLINKKGDVTLAVGPPPLAMMPAANDEEH